MAKLNIMSSSFSVIIIVVLAAVAMMLGINAYLMLRSKKKDEPEDKYVVLHQRFDALSQLLNDQLEKNRQSSQQATLTVHQLLNDQLEKNRESTAKATLSVHQQVQSFTQGMTQLQETVKQVQESVKGVSSFQDIFKSPKLRGIWGESSLEAALNQYFPKDIYEMQHYFKSGEAVDAILKLPNGYILPIDSKFNWENFEKLVNAENDINREIHRKAFYSDVKKKIDEISSKYLLPSESTTDFALMYIPAETVYYEVINNIKDVDIPAYARSKKIFLVSPNTFFLSVSAIMHWFRDVEVSKQTKEIIKKLDKIAQDGTKLGDGFRRLGKHISDAHSSYEDNEKRLSLMMDKVETVLEIGAKEEKVVAKLDIPKA